MATKPNYDSSLSHTRWNCKYYIVFITKIKKSLFDVFLRLKTLECMATWCANVYSS